MLVVVAASEMAGYVNVADEADRDPLLQGGYQIVFLKTLSKKNMNSHFQNNIFFL